jgi:hypothetical protein
MHFYRRHGKEECTCIDVYVNIIQQEDHSENFDLGRRAYHVVGVFWRTFINPNRNAGRIGLVESFFFWIAPAEQRSIARLFRGMPRCRSWFPRLLFS